MKVDGGRMCMHVPAGLLHSRRGADHTARFPGVLAAGRDLGSLVFDGELVAYRGARLDLAALGFSARRRAAAGVSWCMWRLTCWQFYAASPAVSGEHASRRPWLGTGAWWRS
jgi:hypothetical protein